MKIREIMTPSPLSMLDTETVGECARQMHDKDIGSVIVTSTDGQTLGIVTDRDIVLRAVASDGIDPRQVTLGNICTPRPVGVTPEDDVGEAVATMRQQKIRRLPVLEGGRVVGIVSLGDLAIRLDRDSALGEISAAPPNN